MEPGNFEAVMFEDFMKMREETLELLKKIEGNIMSFIRYAEEKRDEIFDKLERVRAAISDDRKGAIILDPLGKLFTVVRIEPLDKDSVYPITFMVRMEPPYIPHFFLTVAYIYLSRNLMPSTLIRTEPIVSLVALLVRGDKLTSVVAQLASSVSLVENFIMGEVSILPFIPSLLDLPVESDTLYLTNLGYSTEPSEELSLNIKLDLSDLPDIPESLLSKLNFRSYRSVLDEILDEVIV